ncbi:quaternary ammonium compound efflux SMR transporter SugE2 [Paenibacillus vulneris]
MGVSWVFLLLAGFMEIIGVILIKKSEGFRRLYWTLACIPSMGLSFYFLSKALVHIPIGTAYSIWTGIGAAGAAIVGIWLYKESKSPKRLFFIGLVIVGVIGLKLTGT